MDNGEQKNCFDEPPQDSPSTTSEDIRTEEENIAQHENNFFANDSPVLGEEIEGGPCHSSRRTRTKRQKVSNTTGSSQ